MGCIRFKIYLLRLLFLTIFGCTTTYAQVSSVQLIEKPTQYRLYPLENNADTSYVRFTGSLNQTQFTQLIFSIYKNGIFSSKYIVAITSPNMSFNEAFPIKAELSNTAYYLHGKNTNGTMTLIHSATDVVAGHIFVVYGQSNALSMGFPTSQSNSYDYKYIRTIGGPNPASTENKWRLGPQNWVGQWPMVLAAKLMEIKKIPIAVINASVGGKPISYFQKTNTPSSTEYLNAYGRLLYRLNAWGLQNKVSAFFWWQGEANTGIGTTRTEYMNALGTLFSDISTDVLRSNSKQYMVQIRGCGGKETSTPNIQEAQRQFANVKNIKLISANGLLQLTTDNCHYQFTQGYEKIGLDWVPFVAKDLGYTSAEPVLSLQPYSIRKINDYQLILIFPLGSAVSADMGSYGKFRVENSAGIASFKATALELTSTTLSSVDSSPTKGLILTFDKPLTAAKGLTYLSHNGTAHPEVWNVVNGMPDKAMINFYSFPIQ